jgi:hypothetical protein
MENAGLIEMTLVFSFAVALCLWELWTLRRDRRRAEAREAQRRAGSSGRSPD